MPALLRVLAILVLVLALPALAADSPQFRGPDRDGIFKETGLAKSWPEGGPKMLWSADGLGESYASVAVAGGRIYTTGKTKDRGSAYALGLDGQQIWATEYGAAHSGSGYPGTRTTPTFADGMLYLVSSMGRAIALDAKSGEIQWQVDLLAEYDADNIYFGMSESPLVDGDRLIVTPGGKKGSVVALDRETGKTVWASSGVSGLSAYCNPRIFEHGGRRQIVTMVQQHVVGLDPADGKALWTEPSKVSYDIHAVSPVFVDDTIYVTHGYNQGGTLYRLADDGKSVTKVWHEPKLDVHHGGAVAMNGHIYGAASNGTWYALQADNGEIAASIPRLGKGAVIAADGLLYGYTEAGKVVLVDPDPANFKEISSFTVTLGEGQHWSHPVISGGVLYVRHGDVLMAFDVKG